MANTVIQLKKSSTPGSSPSTGNLANGELAINFADGVIYYKNLVGQVAQFTAPGKNYGTVNANGTLLVSGIAGDVFTILPGQNITVVGDAVNDRVTIGADLTSANGWANTKLANTSGVSFAGNLFFPTGNVGIGTSSPSSKLQVNGTITIVNTGPVESFRSGANTITLNMYDEANGTLSWEGSAGQLFSITNDLSGSLFTVNDVSGIPSIEVDALGNVDLAPFGGNVGIGTSNPVYKLDVQGDARITGNLTLGDATTDTVTINAANFNLANNVSFDSGTLFIDVQNNRVGVGITNPQHSLSVNGSIHLTTGDGDRIWSGSNNLRLGSYPQLAVSDTLQIIGGQQSIVFGGTGAYATIGSNVPWDFVKGTTPQGIRIHGTFTNVSNYERLNISVNSTAAYIQTENAGTGVARPLYLGANNATAVTIDTAGRVGIGTTSPAYTLDVNGTIESYGSLSTLYSPTGSVSPFATSTALRGLRLQNTDNTTNTAVGIDFVAGSSSTATSYIVGIREGSFLGALAFGTRTNVSGDYAEAMRITSAGRVGIGTTSPSAKLDVVAGTSTSNTTSLVNLTQTWNNSGNTFTAIQTNITDTASASASKLIDLQVAGNTKFKVEKTGDIYIAHSRKIESFPDSYNNYTSIDFGAQGSASMAFYQNGTPATAFRWNDAVPGVRLISTNSLNWSSTGNAVSAADLAIWRDGSNILAQRFGTSAQTFRLYGTYTDSSNYERLSFFANSTAAYIQTQNGGTGTARPLYLGANNQTVVSINADKSVGVKQTLTGRSSIDHVTYSIFEAGVDAVYLCNNYNRSGPGYPPDTIYIGGLASDNFSRDLFKISSTNVITTGALFQVVRPAVDPTVMGAGALQISRGVGTNSLGIGTSANDQYAWLQYSLDGAAKNIVLSPVGGNVGIGTTSPSARLHANTSSGTVAQFTGGSDSGVIFAAGGLVGFTDPAGNNGFIFNSTSNYAYAQTNGSERMRITSAGNVGIGTSAPSSTLHVIGTANITSSVTASDYNSSTTGYKISGTQVLYYSGGVTYLNDLGGGIGLRTASTTRLFIDTSGNVGINTSSPKALLDVKPLSTSNTFSMVISSGQTVNGFGSLRYTTSYAHNDLLLGNFQDASGYSQTAISFGYTGDPARKLHIGSANSATFDSNASFVPAVTVTSGGRLGVGTTSPATTLHVIGTANVSSTIYTRDIEAPFYSLYNEGAGAYVGIKGNYLRFGGVSEFMRIANTSGFVGIGTTTPGAPLHVYRNVSGGSPIGVFEAGSAQSSIIELKDGAGTPNRWWLVSGLGTTTDGTFSIYDARQAVSRLNINSSGNIGIATLTPSALLDVSGSIKGAGLTLTGSSIISGSNRVTVDCLTASSKSRVLGWGANTSTRGTLSLGVLASDSSLYSDSIFIDSTTNVGIGTTAPQTVLDVAGSDNNGIQYRTATRWISIGSSGGLSTVASGSGTEMVFSVGSERMRINANGNIGIGTTTPTAVGSSATLSINSATAGASGVLVHQYNGSQIARSGVLSGYYTVQDLGSTNGLMIDEQSALPILFRTNATERMRITANGNVGIDTTSPGGKLTVAQPSGAYTSSAPFFSSLYDNTQHFNIYMDGNWNTHLSSIQVSTNQSALAFDTNGSERMRITSGGDVLINQTSSLGTGKLGVAGRIAIDVNGSDSFSGQLYLTSPNGWPSNIQAAGPSSNGIAFWTYTGSWSERVRITGAGNVGVGTISPAEKLEVNGNIKANSYIMANSAMAPITVITATTTDQIVDSFTTSTWRSAQYNITMTAGTDYHTTQISLIHDGTNAYITEYGTLSTANNLGTFSATVSGSTVRLNVVPTFANTSINMLRTTNK